MADRAVGCDARSRRRDSDVSPSDVVDTPSFGSFHEPRSERSQRTLVSWVTRREHSNARLSLRATVQARASLRRQRRPTPLARSLFLASPHTSAAPPSRGVVMAPARVAARARPRGRVARLRARASRRRPRERRARRARASSVAPSASSAWAAAPPRPGARVVPPPGSPRRPCAGPSSTTPSPPRRSFARSTTSCSLRSPASPTRASPPRPSTRSTRATERPRRPIEAPRRVRDRAPARDGLPARRDPPSRRGGARRRRYSRG